MCVFIIQNLFFSQHFARANFLFSANFQRERNNQDDVDEVLSFLSFFLFFLVFGLDNHINVRDAASIVDLDSNISTLHIRKNFVKN